tara:strand:+ start:214 stop:621 length:408 start_codon:yes stop_codon:yes gene_type:complete
MVDKKKDSDEVANYDAIVAETYKKISSIEKVMYNSSCFNGGFEKLEEKFSESHDLLIKMSDKMNDPEEGLITRVREIERWKADSESVLKYNEKQNQDLLLLKIWQKKVDRFLWFGLIAVFGVIIKTLFGVMIGIE